jgi:hypothetical protein
VQSRDNIFRFLYVYESALPVTASLVNSTFRVSSTFLIPPYAVNFYQICHISDTNYSLGPQLLASFIGSTSGSNLVVLPYVVHMLSYLATPYPGAAFSEVRGVFHLTNNDHSYQDFGSTGSTSQSIDRGLLCKPLYPA